ncbi:MAG: TetR family transcriptional regulator [Rhizobiales bacterium]|nr:TetR family transcriptional regulator [Hyphomicrobiales bacterium]
MAYRRTERVIRRLAARREDILAAARDAVAEGGMAAVQIVPVAERAGIAAGTVYRYFPSKTELVNELVEQACAREVETMRRAAEAAPGPLSAIAAAVAALGQRALQNRKLAWALIGEPADTETGAVRHACRAALAGEFGRLIRTAAAAGLLPAEQSPAVTAPALVGAMIEGLIGPLAPEIESNPARQREAVQSLTLLVLRALGVADARARGLVVQIALPAVTEGAA